LSLRGKWREVQGVGRKGGREGSGKEGRNEGERRAYLNGLKFLVGIPGYCT